MNLPEAVRHARKELGLSRGAFARLAGLHPNMISRLENGDNVTIETVRRVLRHLPNLRSFTLETAAVDVAFLRTEPWNEGALAAARYLAGACQHVIDRVTGRDGEIAIPGRSAPALSD